MSVSDPPALFRGKVLSCRSFGPGKTTAKVQGSTGRGR